MIVAIIFLVLFFGGILFVAVESTREYLKWRKLPKATWELDEIVVSSGGQRRLVSHAVRSEIDGRRMGYVVVSDLGKRTIVYNVELGAWRREDILS